MTPRTRADSPAPVHEADPQLEADSVGGATVAGEILDDGERPWWNHVLRALARRLPWAHIAFNWGRAQIRHRAIQARQLLSLRRLRLSAAWIGVELARQRRRSGEERLTVAVDAASFWEPLTGIGWYLYRLLEHLADRDDLRLRLYGPTCVGSPDLDPPQVQLPSGPAIEFVRHDVPDGFVVPGGWIIKLLRRLEPLLIALDRNEVLFAPNYFLPRRFDAAGGARVATIHDLGLRRFAWTLRRETILELSDKLDHALFEASRLITVSRAIRDEMIADGLAGPGQDGPDGRIHAIHHGPGQLAAVEPGTTPEETPASFALHVGTIEPRKNVGALLSAWERLAEIVAEPPTLLLCGKFGWKSEEVARAVERAERKGWARHLGYVTDAELAALYRDARVVVFPTLYEGFGLPAVEALWAETPLVCSDLAVLREVTGGAAVFADPGDPEAFAGAVARVLDDAGLRERLAAEGRQRVAELSWSRAAERTAAVWRAAAGRGARP